MNQIDLITKKRDGKELSPAEIKFLISGYANNTIPDYQFAAFLMATYFRGMTERETAVLTKFMRDSGAVLQHDALPGFKADKHSTGGVGDKVSLILAPLVAAAGLYVPMISGRALAHTGGTLDKLEAIPGFRTNFSLTEIESTLQEIGVVLVGQTENLAPADKKIYALRDATATVNSIPLITASILSKKLAEGINALVIDVKTGSGAIFKEKEKARELAAMLVKTAGHFNLQTAAILTAMEQPLGNTVGNWLETEEAIATLHGAGSADLTELTLVLSAQMLVFGGKAASIAEGITILQEKISSGAAFDKFIQIVRKHGGDITYIQKPESYPKSKYIVEIKSDTRGYVSGVDAREIGSASMALGAGRGSVEAKIDYTSGIVLMKKIGDFVNKDESIAIVHTNSKELLDENMGRVKQAFSFSDKIISPEPLIYSMIAADGEKFWDDVNKVFV